MTLSGCTWNPACYLYLLHAAPFLWTALCLCPHLWLVWRLCSKFFDLKLPRSCGGTSKWLELGLALGSPSSLGWARVCSELFNSSKFATEPRACKLLLEGHCRIVGQWLMWWTGKSRARDICPAPGSHVHLFFLSVMHLKTLQVYSVPRNPTNLQEIDHISDTCTTRLVLKRAQRLKELTKRHQWLSGMSVKSRSNERSRLFGASMNDFLVLRYAYERTWKDQCTYEVHGRMEE